MTEDTFADLRTAAEGRGATGMASIKEIVSEDAFKKFKRLDDDWRQFSVKVLQSEISLAEPFSSTLPLHCVQAFIRFIVRKSKGTHGLISVETAWRKWQELRRLTVLRGGPEYTPAYQKQMKHMISNLPKSEGASTVGRAKPLASIEVVKDLIYFLWACDEFTFQHPRIRIQLSFAMLFMMYQGLRPGEFTEASSRRNSNEGFLYRDFELQRQVLPDGTKTWVLLVNIRLRKNHRNLEKDNVQHILREEPGRPHLCPVAHYVALALADGAFQSVKSVDDLQRVKVRSKVRLAKDKMDVPILRQIDPAGNILPDRVFTADSMGSYLRGLGERAGYLDRLTAYAFRRGHANKLDKMVSAVERRQRMGHVSDDTMQYYISRISGLDTQSIVFDRTPNQQVYDFVRSMANNNDPGAPISNGSRLTDPRRSGGPTQSRLDVPQTDLIHKKKRRPFDVQRSQRKAALRLSRQKYMEERNEFQECEDELESEETDSEELESGDGSGTCVQPANLSNPYAIERAGPSALLLSQLRFEPARSTFIQFFDARVPPTLADSVAPLQALADVTPRPVHYHDAYPDEHNACCRCLKPLGSMGSKQKANRHLLSCLRKELVSQAEQKVSCCPEMTALVACRWSCCKHSFGTSKNTGVAAHLTRHVDRSQDSICWWQDCAFRTNSKPALAVHLLDKHGLYCEYTLPSTVNYCYECGAWVEGRDSWDSHCNMHLSSLSSTGLHCGQIVRHGLIVVAAKCVFCLGESNLSPSKRFHQYADCCDLHRHIGRHLKHLKRDTDWPLQCPHPLCSHSASHAEDFWLHLTNHHGIEARSNRSIRSGPSGQMSDITESMSESSSDDFESTSSETDLAESSSSSVSNDPRTPTEKTDIFSAGSVDIVDVHMDDVEPGCFDDCRSQMSAARHGPKTSEVTQRLLNQFKVRRNARSSSTWVERTGSGQPASPSLHGDTITKVPMRSKVVEVRIT